MGLLVGVKVGLLLQAVEAAAFASSSGWMCPHTSVCALTLRGRVPNLCSRPRPQRESGITRVSAQIKFADAVEHVLIRKWDKKKVSRVVKSWRRMDEDYIHKEFKEEHDTWQVDSMHSSLHVSLPSLSLTCTCTGVQLVRGGPLMQDLLRPV